MALIDEVKVALRISTDDAGITAEIETLIEAAKLDLTKTADIADFTEPDSLVKRAIITYVKSMWTNDSVEAERLTKSYESIKATLAMSSAYGTYSEGT